METIISIIALIIIFGFSNYSMNKEARKQLREES